MQPGDELPELQVTPDRYLTVRYAGASGDFNPIHIDEEFATRSACPAGSCTACGRWPRSRAPRPRPAGGPRRCSASRSSSAAWALPEQEVVVTATVREVARRRGDDRRRGARRTARGSSAAARPRSSRPLLESDGVLTPRQELLLAQGGRGLRRDRPARGLEGARRRRRARPPGRRRSATSSPCSRSTGCSRTRTPRPAACRPTPATATTSTAAAGSAVDARSSRARSALPLVRREVDEAMRVTTETLSQVTNLLAIVSAPPIETTTIRHVEVLLLQPQVLMVVVITSTGGVSKRVFTFERPVDAGLAEWAAAYLNERARRASASARACCTRGSTTRRCRRPSARSSRARARLHRAGRDRRGHALRRRRRAAAGRAPLPGPLPAQRADGDARAPRARCSACCAPRSPSATSTCASARENEAPALQRPVARRRQLRAAAAQPRHRLGDRPDAHGLRARDRRRARGRRVQLSRFVEDVYDELTAMPRDSYEVLGVARDADETEIKKAFRRLARELHPDVNATTRTPRRSSRRPPRPTRSSPTPSAAPPTTATATRACARAATRPNFDGFGSVSDLFARLLRRRRLRRRVRRRPRPRRGAIQGGDVAVAVDDRPRRGGARRDRSRSPTRSTARCEHCHGNGAEPGTPIVTCARCDGAGPAAGGRAHAVRPGRAHRGVRRVRRRRARARAAVHGAATAAGACAEQRTLAVDVPAGIADGQRIRLTGRGHAGERGGPPGDLYVLVRVREDERFVRDGDDLVTVDRRRRRRWPRSARRSQVPTLDGDVPRRDPRRHAAGRDDHAARRAGCRRCGAAARATCACVVNVVIPRRLSARAARAARAARRARSTERQPARATRACSPSSSARSPGERPDPPRACAVRVRRERAEIVLAELLELLRRRGWRRPTLGGRGRVRRLRRAGRAAASCRRSRRAAGDALVDVSTHRGRPTTGPTAGRQFHRPVEVAAARPAAAGAPAVGAGAATTAAIEVVIDPGAGVRHRRAPTTRLCLELLLELDAGGAAVRLGLRLGRARDRRGAARLRPGRRRSTSTPRAAEAIRARTRRERRRGDVRRGRPAPRRPPPWAPTVRRQPARRAADRDRRARRSEPPPERLIASGLLAARPTRSRRPSRATACASASAACAASGPRVAAGSRRDPARDARRPRRTPRPCSPSCSSSRPAGSRSASRRRRGRVRALRRAGRAARRCRDAARGGGRRARRRLDERGRPTTGRSAGRRSTGRSTCAGASARLRVRPPWEPPLDGDGIDLVIDPGQAFGTGAHHTTRLCLELLLELEPGRRARRLGLRHRRAGDRRGAARLGPGAGVRPRGRVGRGDARERRAPTACRGSRSSALRPAPRRGPVGADRASPTSSRPLLLDVAAADDAAARAR